LLTVLPVGAPDHLDRRTVGRAMALAPLVGLVLALAADVVVVLLRVFTKVPGERPQALLPAAVGIALLALFTRGLHLDGLADLADGLGTRRDRALEVMRDPALGAFGAVTLLFVVLIQVGALSTTIVAHRGTLSLVVSAMTGRLAATLACTPGVPAARPDGLGALVAGSVRPARAGLSFLGVVTVAALAGRFDVDGGDASRAVRAVVAVCVGTATALALRRWLVRRLGGITGDVLGGMIELTSTVTLVMMAMTIPDGLTARLGLS
jgi:adenosylcobinamide-GDP ribazoletransferase